MGMSSIVLPNTAGGVANNCIDHPTALTTSITVHCMSVQQFNPFPMCLVFFSQAAPEYIPEKVKKAEKKLEENPYDLDAWSILIREAQV